MNITLGDGDGSLTRNIHGPTLRPILLLKDTESETSAVVPFWSYVWLRLLSSGYFKGSLTFFSMCHQLLLLFSGVTFSFCSLCLHFAAHKLAFLLLLWNPLWILLSRLQLEWVVDDFLYLRSLGAKWWIQILRRGRRLTPGGGTKSSRGKQFDSVRKYSPNLNVRIGIHHLFCSLVKNKGIAYSSRSQ